MSIKEIYNNMMVRMGYRKPEIKVGRRVAFVNDYGRFVKVN